MENLVKVLAESTLAQYSVVLILISLIALIIVRNSSDKMKASVFVLTLVGVAFFGLSLILHESPQPSSSNTPVESLEFGAIVGRIVGTNNSPLKDVFVYAMNKEKGTEIEAQKRISEYRQKNEKIDTTKEAKTDKNGYFKIPKLPIGAYKVFFYSYYSKNDSLAIDNVKVAVNSKADLGRVELETRSSRNLWH